MLKIIGIIILALIALILFVVCLILFPAVRYKINLRADGDIKSIKGIIKVRYLLGIISFVAEYPDGLKMGLRLFGIPVSKRKKKKKKRDVHDAKEEKEEQDAQTTQDTQTAQVTQDAQGEQATQDEQTGRYAKEDRRTSSRRKVRIKPYIDVIRDTQNKVARDTIKKTFFRLIRHCGPRKLKADMVIGTGDPCNTGLLFGGLGLVTTRIKGEYHLSPDFYNKRLDGYIYIKGRIRSVVILYHFLKIYADRDIKRMAAQIRKVRR